MNKLITNRFYHPVLYFFLLALLSIVFGSIASLNYESFHLFPLLIFYLYILINQFIESLLVKITKQSFEFSRKILFFLELVNFIIIIFFSNTYSLNAGFILLLYTFIIQLQFLFSYYELEKLAIIISTFFKIILLNGFAFYIHLNFITYQPVLYSLVIFFPYLNYELRRSSKIRSTKMSNILMLLSYLTAIIILWSKLSYLSLFLFLSLPFTLINSREKEAKNAASSLIIFSIFYLVLLLLSFI